MVSADAGLHADQARRQVGKAGLDLATRPFLAQYDGTLLIVAYNVERVLADIDANHGDCSVDSHSWSDANTFLGSVQQAQIGTRPQAPPKFW
jgi:hypothetical protein